MTAVIVGATLAAYLPTAVVLHRLGQARAERRAQRRLPTQGIALKAVVLAWVLALTGLGVGSVLGGVSVAWDVWTALVVSGLGYCYWLLVCITESSRRYMIAELVDQHPGITPAEIVRRYNRFPIIAARLERLEHWGNLRRNGDRYLPHRGLMLTASILVRGWAGVLGFAWPHAFKKRSSQP